MQFHGQPGEDIGSSATRGRTAVLCAGNRIRVPQFSHSDIIHHACPTRPAWTEFSLTAAGQALLESWNAARDRAGREVLDGLTPSERRRLNDLLATALRRTARARADADSTCRLCNWPVCAECPVDESVGDSP